MLIKVEAQNFNGEGADRPLPRSTPTQHEIADGQAMLFQKPSFSLRIRELTPLDLRAIRRLAERIDVGCAVLVGKRGSKRTLGDGGDDRGVGNPGLAERRVSSVHAASLVEWLLGRGG